MNECQITVCFTISKKHPHYFIYVFYKFFVNIYKYTMNEIRMKTLLGHNITSDLLQKNTSLAAKGALAHRLQRRTRRSWAF